MASRYFCRASVESEGTGTSGLGHSLFFTQPSATARIHDNSKAIKRAARVTSRRCSRPSRCRSLSARFSSRKYEAPNVIAPPTTTPNKPKIGVRRSGLRYHGARVFTRAKLTRPNLNARTLSLTYPLHPLSVRYIIVSAFTKNICHIESARRQLYRGVRKCGARASCRAFARSRTVDDG